ncbi:MAG: glucans biosynthesis glucosyltransferase MdoH [Gemmobacter sp.]
MMDRPDPAQFDPATGDGAFAPPVAPLPMPNQPLRGVAARARCHPALRADAGTRAWRVLAVAGSVAVAVLAAATTLRVGAADGIGALDLLRAGLMLLAVWWLAWCAGLVLVGLAARPRIPPEEAGALCLRVVVIVPICDEDPEPTFARLRATAASLAATGQGQRFDIAILSDSRDPGIADHERRLVRHGVPGVGHVFYRHRADNTGRKAGNIRDFLQGSGAAWDAALVLDADSRMEGRTILAMARRIAADPGLGLVQTLPHISAARSRFGRAMQFAQGLQGPVLARGLAALQGPAGAYWGHNAMIRIPAFAAACGLPTLPGRPPFGGAILSHDTLEAALLVRAGWRVRLDPDLEGSWEEAPETLIDHARRDRRWCQGNLQHLGVIAAPGLARWSRFVLAQGIMAYLAPVLWLVWLAVTVPGAPGLDVTGGGVTGGGVTAEALVLGGGILALLVLPRLLIAAEAVATGRAAGFGGGWAVLRDTLAEIALSALIAPVLMLLQVRAVAQVLCGRDAGWPPQDRRGGCVGWDEAWGATRAVVLAGAGMAAAGAVWVPEVLAWLVPVVGPLLLAPAVVVVLSGRQRGGMFAAPQPGAEAVQAAPSALPLSQACPAP